MQSIQIILKKLSVQNPREKLNGTKIVRQIEWIGQPNRKTKIRCTDEIGQFFELSYHQYYSWNLYCNRIITELLVRDLQLELFAVPAPPQSLSGSVNESTVTLTWSTPTDSGTHPVEKYEIYRADSIPAIYQPIGSVSATTLQFVDTINPATRYYYLVHAVSAAGRSAPSNGWSNQSGSPEPPGPQSIGSPEVSLQLFVEG